MRKMYQISLWILPAIVVLLTGIARADERAEFRSEVFADRIRENYQSSLANEERIGEYQLEKTIVDVHGQRVRIEEYLLRPSSNQIQFLTLNTRANRFDYGYQTLTFSKDVSSEKLGDLSQAIWMSFGEGEKPTYWLTNYDGRLSNNRDHVDVNMTIGKPIPIKITIEMPEVPIVVAEGGEGEDVIVDEEMPMPVDEVMPTSFSVYFPSSMEGRVSINGKPKEEFSLQNTLSADGKYEKTTVVERYITSGGMKTGAEYVEYIDNMGSMYSESEYENKDVNPKYECSYGDKAYYTELVTYKDGSWVKYEEYQIDDQGKIMDWNYPEYIGEGIGEGDNMAMQEAMQEYFAQQPNREMIISASEFEGRTIDLVIAPMKGPDGMPIDMFMW